jgi:hypothetical protein
LDSENPQLQELRRRLEQEEAAYAECLKAFDALASFPLPEEQIKNLGWLMGRLNALWQAAPKPEAGGLQGAFTRRAWDAVAPALDRQADFNSMLVQTLNGQVEENAKLHAHLRTLVSALLRYLQRLLPLIDARDRAASAQAVERAELILEAFSTRSARSCAPSATRCEPGRHRLRCRRRSRPWTVRPTRRSSDASVANPRSCASGSASTSRSSKASRPSPTWAAAAASSWT